MSSWKPLWRGDTATFTIKFTLHRPAAEWLARQTGWPLAGAARWLRYFAFKTPALDYSRVCAGAVLVMDEGVPAIVDGDTFDAEHWPVYYNGPLITRSR